MSTQTVCDECNEPKPCPFKVTEADGKVYDICSAACYTAHAKSVEARA